MTVEKFTNGRTDVHYTAQPKGKRILAGAVKSLTIQLNGLIMASLIWYWNDPALIWMPDKIKIIVVIILGINILLRFKTNKSLYDKGKPNPNKTDQLRKQMTEDLRQELKSIIPQNGITQLRSEVKLIATAMTKMKKTQDREIAKLGDEIGRLKEPKNQ